MNVLVIGGGGREHAICHALARSRRLQKLFVLPGNAGTAQLGTNIPGDTSDIKLALSVAKRENIGLTIVGPEDPLAAGMVDAFEQAGLRIFGPKAAAARLESDKAFAKQLMRQHAVPTAEARIFEHFDAAREFISTRDDEIVVKAAGLAKGKGVILCPDPAQAILAAERMLIDRIFGDAGRKIVVEEKLSGPEVSILAIVDGRTIFVLESAQDHKRLLDNDEGPNTGGMGAFSPSARLDAAMLRTVQSQILVPTLDALLREGIHYRGVLYAGLMLTAAGPKVLEFNCRFGDPETQALLIRLKSDLLELLDATVSGALENADVQWDPRPSLCVVMAAKGYPEKSQAGAVIRGLPKHAADDAVVYHAGTKLDGERVLVSGGRVLGVTALGETLESARERAYGVVDRVQFDGAQFRRDIGLRT